MVSSVRLTRYAAQRQRSAIVDFPQRASANALMAAKRQILQDYDQTKAQNGKDHERLLSEGGNEVNAMTDVEK